MNSKEDDRKGHRITYDVYVGRLPKSIDELKLFDVFSKYGDICDILCRHGKGTFGYAIVKFREKKDADRVLKETDRVSVDGNDMDVRHAVRSSHGAENGNGNMYGKPLPPYPEIAPTMMSMRGINYIQPPVAAPESNCMYHIPEYPDYEQDGKQMSIMVEVMCTSVENAVTFYGCPIFRYEELHSLSMKMNSICPNLMRLLRKPSENRIYGAVYGEDMSWYRCSVIQNCIPAQPGTCIVQYIDYGNLDEVSYTQMVDLPEPIKRVSTFAVKCILSNLVCNSKSNDVSYLHHLVNQRMSLCAISSWGVPQYSVLKCSCNGIDVVSELVRNGFAVYKNRKGSNSKTAPNASKSEKGTLRPQDSCKPSKKTNGIGPSSKTPTGSRESNNQSERRLPSEVVNLTPSNLGRRSTQVLVTENGHQLCTDFVPKMIIKRGSHITDAAPLTPVAEVAQGVVVVKESINHLLKIDSVLSNLKLVNNIRELVSINNDDNLISSAVNLLMSEADVKPTVDSVNDVKEAYREYNNVLNEIKNCTDQTLLQELKGKRELQKNELCSKLMRFLQAFDVCVLEKQKNIQQMITHLESNSNAWMNVYLQSPPATVEDLWADYNKAKESKWNIIQRARETTNEMHKRFFEFLLDFQKEFSLNKMEGNVDLSNQLGQTGGKKGSWAVKLEESILNLGSALEEEIKTCNVSKGRSCVSVIQCILDKIDIPKEKIDAECETYEKYKALFNDLRNMTDLRNVFSELATVKEDIKVLNPICENSEDSETGKDTSHFIKLHNALSKEDSLVEALAKASALHYPELVLEHPELNLSEYQNNAYLVKHSWRKEFFPVLGTSTRVEPSFTSKFADHLVMIKEFTFENDSEKISFTKKAIVWNEIKSKALTKVQALFNKDEKTACAIVPHVSPTLLENPLPVSIERKSACNVLQQILMGLKDIHSRGMAHGAVHPLAILHDNGEVLLDFNYDLRFIQDKLLIKGINFQIPSGEDMCKSADMYGFGCLVLWILFPNLSFTSTKQGVPNLSAFQSILEELLFGKDFAFLAALLNANPDLRPSSRMLLSSGFLKDLRIISNT